MAAVALAYWRRTGAPDFHPKPGLGIATSLETFAFQLARTAPHFTLRFLANPGGADRPCTPLIFL